MSIFRYITLVGLLAISLLIDPQLIAYGSNLQLHFANPGSGRLELAQSPEILALELSHRGSGRLELAQSPEILAPELSYRGSGRLELAQSPEIIAPELS
ncbi:MAG: hypothetical protein F6J92_40985, partial [Symploca sp. SIO1A3]|nr:hypothetical protein [Symploca sp. SIO1A3]